MRNEGTQLETPAAFIDETKEVATFTSRANVPLGWKAKHRNVSIRRDGPDGDWVIEPLPASIREEAWTVTTFRAGPNPVALWYPDSVKIDQWFGRAAEIDRRI